MTLLPVGCRKRVRTRYCCMYTHHHLRMQGTSAGTLHLPANCESYQYWRLLTPPTSTASRRRKGSTTAATGGRTTTRLSTATAMGTTTTTSVGYKFPLRCTTVRCISPGCPSSPPFPVVLATTFQTCLNDLNDI